MNSSKQYRCYGCGWCCQIDKYSSVVEFNLARETLLKKGIKLTGTMLPNGMVLWPRRCPALVKNKCVIYDIRPYPCRQFLCGRQSKKDKRPWRSDGTFNMEYFNWLLKNNAEFAKVKKEMEDKAANWGLRHGWNLRRVTP